MLSQGNSNATARPRRAKSTSSFQSRDIQQEYRTIVSENKRQQALTAANVAYERAMGSNRSELDSAHSGPLAGLKAETASDGVLRRAQSVRFAGPKAIPNRKYTNTALEEQTYQRMNGRSSMQKQRPARWDLDRPRDLQTTSPAVEYPSPASSSYRRLKKAKPIYSPRKQPSTISVPGRPKDGENHRQARYFPSNNEYTIQDFPQSPETSTTESASILMVPFEQTEKHSPGTAVLMARDQYLRQVEQERLKGRISFLDLHRRQTSKTFRRTVRSNSTTPFGNGIASPLSEPNVKLKGFSDKARSISLTVKNKIKRVFQRRKSHNELPAQQIDSHRPHFHDYGSSALGLDQDGLPLPTPDDSIPDQANTRSQSPHQMPVRLDLVADTGSMRSVQSSEHLSVTKSRVTSWADSSAANTMTRQQLLEGKRLSIIQENGGPHQPSSSAGRIGFAARRGYAVFKNPMKVRKNGDRSSQAFESQRIVSALHKKLEEEQNRRLRQEEALDGKSSGGDSSTPRPSREGLRSSSANHGTSPDTIRETRTHSRGAPNDAPGIQYTEFLYSNDVALNRTDEKIHPLRSHPVHHHPVNESQDPFQGYAAQRTVEYNEQSGREGETRPLREVKSVNFPLTSEHQRRNVSPYPVMIPSTMHDNQHDAEVRFSKSNMSLRANRYPNSMRMRVASNVPSESTYSRTTSGRTPPMNASSPSLDNYDGNAELGVEANVTYDPGDQTDFAAPIKIDSTSSRQSSNGWKGWMASQVQKLGHQDHEKTRPDSRCFTQDMRDQREKACTGNDDIEIDSIQRSDSPHNKPLAAIQIGRRPRPPMIRKMSDQMIEKYPLRFPLIERTNSSYINNQRTSSSILGKEPNNKSINGPDNENERRLPSQVYRRSNDGLQESVESFQSQKEYWSKKLVNRTVPDRTQFLTISDQDDRRCIPKTRSTASIYTRSPERAARLRRIRNTATPNTKDVRYQGMLRQAPSYYSETPSIGGSTAPNSSSENVNPYEGAGLTTTGLRGVGSQRLVDSFLRKHNRKVHVVGEDDGGTCFI